MITQTESDLQEIKDRLETSIRCYPRDRETNQELLNIMTKDLITAALLPTIIINASSERPTIYVSIEHPEIKKIANTLSFCITLDDWRRIKTPMSTEPKNNDEVDNCYWCGSKTIILNIGFSKKVMKVCSNCKK